LYFTTDLQRKTEPTVFSEPNLKNPFHTSLKGSLAQGLQVICGLTTYTHRDWDLLPPSTFVSSTYETSFRPTSGPDFAGGGPGANIEDVSSLINSLDHIKNQRTGLMNTTFIWWGPYCLNCRTQWWGLLLVGAGLMAPWIP